MNITILKTAINVLSLLLLLATSVTADEYINEKVFHQDENGKTLVATLVDSFTDEIVGHIIMLVKPDFTRGGEFKSLFIGCPTPFTGLIGLNSTIHGPSKENTGSMSIRVDSNLAQYLTSTTMKGSEVFGHGAPVSDLGEFESLLAEIAKGYELRIRVTTDTEAVLFFYELRGTFNGVREFRRRCKM